MGGECIGWRLGKTRLAGDTIGVFLESVNFMYMYQILTHEYHKRPVSYVVKQIPN